MELEEKLEWLQAVKDVIGGKMPKADIIKADLQHLNRLRKGEVDVFLLTGKSFVMSRIKFTSTMAKKFLRQFLKEASKEAT